MGLEDCFEGIICFETLNPTHKSVASDDEDDIQFLGSRISSTVTTDNNDIFDIIRHFSQPNASTSELPKTPIVCKPSEHAIEKALEMGNINPQRTVCQRIISTQNSLNKSTLFCRFLLVESL